MRCVARVCLVARRSIFVALTFYLAGEATKQVRFQAGQKPVVLRWIRLLGK